MPKNFVSNFKVGKYFLLGKKYLEFMKNLPTATSSNLTDLYVVFMFELEGGGDCVKSFKDKTPSQVGVILDHLVAKLADMPDVMKEEIKENYRIHG